MSFQPEPIAGDRCPSLNAVRQRERNSSTFYSFWAQNGVDEANPH